MDCLNGIRVFSAVWVIYAHAHVMTMMGPLYNFAYVPEVKLIGSMFKNGFHTDKMFCLVLVHQGKDHCVRITLPIICGHLSLSQWPISYMVATQTHG